MRNSSETRALTTARVRTRLARSAYLRVLIWDRRRGGGGRFHDFYFIKLEKMDAQAVAR